ncbi:MAG: hypothetical protein ACFCUT_08035 [Kiloniellaceae bacterium]
MRFDLIPYTPGIVGGYLAEFHPGPPAACHWSERSLYMDGDVFEALVFLVGPFTLKVKTPVILEGAAVERLADELDDIARQVSHAESPKAIWPYSASYGYTQFNSVRDWPCERQAFTRMLRELGAWTRKAQDGGQPVSIRSM